MTHLNKTASNQRSPTGPTHAADEGPGPADSRHKSKRKGPKGPQVYYDNNSTDEDKMDDIEMAIETGKENHPNRLRSKERDDQSVVYTMGSLESQHFSYKFKNLKKNI